MNSASPGITRPCGRSGTSQTAEIVSRLRRNLATWSRFQQRELPWRQARDPYAIWISEVMLQQTTVEAVRPRYKSFLRRFPTIRRLASARLDAVLAEWSGLGYYARARNLHAAARLVVSRHAGRLPETARELRLLPGFGPYTAAAVAALAFGERTFPIDANIRRVVSRLFATDDPESFLPDLIGRNSPGDSIAALFDLGQLVCIASKPECSICPVRLGCRARIGGLTARFPKRAQGPAIREISLAVAAIERDGRLFLQRKATGWLAGLWEFPSAEGETPSAAARRLEKTVAITRAPVAHLRHVIVGRRFDIAVYRPGAAARADRKGRWMTRGQIERGAVSTLTRKILRSLASAKDPA